MKRFKVYDLYEGNDCIGYADTLREVKKIARIQYDETDGECDIFFVELDQETQHYDFSKGRFIPVI